MRHRGLRYMPALDGLRALAVLAVLLYHGNVSWAHGGYFGVDAFFVLSGFLITGLLLAEWRDAGGINFKQFWVRRARRLLPALVLVVVAVAIYAARYAMPIELHQLRRDALSTIGYVANWSQIFAAPVVLRAVRGAVGAEAHVVARDRRAVLSGLAVARLRGDATRARFEEGVARRLCRAGAPASAIEMAVLYSPGHDPSRASTTAPTRACSRCSSARSSRSSFRGARRSLPRRPHRVARRRDRGRDRPRVHLGADEGDRLLAVPRRLCDRRGVGRHCHRERDAAGRTPVPSAGCCRARRCARSG